MKPRKTRSISTLICSASSLVGAKINANGPSHSYIGFLVDTSGLRVKHSESPVSSSSFGSEFMNPPYLICATSGATKERVFPDPVCEIPIQSRPWRAKGQNWLWIGVGLGKFCSFNFSRISGKLIKASSNVRQGLLMWPSSGFLSLELSDRMVTLLFSRRQVLTSSDKRSLTLGWNKIIKITFLK